LAQDNDNSKIIVSNTCANFQDQPPDKFALPAKADTKFLPEKMFL